VQANQGYILGGAVPVKQTKKATLSTRTASVKKNREGKKICLITKKNKQEDLDKKGEKINVRSVALNTSRGIKCAQQIHAKEDLERETWKTPHSHDNQSWGLNRFDTGAKKRGLIFFPVRQRKERGKVGGAEREGWERLKINYSDSYKSEAES